MPEDEAEFGILEPTGPDQFLDVLHIAAVADFRPEVLKWRPSRNELGQVVAPAVVCLTASPPAPAL
jgi:hypothetical protein